MTALTEHLEKPAPFELPPELEASSPPESRGLRRDGVRLLVAHKGSGLLENRHFTDLPSLLEPGDVLAVNTSATLPAELAARIDGPGGEPYEEVALHLSGRLPGGLWIVEPRRYGSQGSGSPTLPWLDAPEGTHLRLPAGGRAELRLPANSSDLSPSKQGHLHQTRLWVAQLDLPEPLLPYLARHGRAIRYSHVPDPWPISYYQTVFAEHPGSAEMPSAARPFTAEVVTRLASRGIVIAPFVLHCGVASPEAHEPPAPEWFRVPPTSAALINEARLSRHRVIAVGTTAVRALETVAGPGGEVHPGEGWTEVVIGPDRLVRAVDGLITGWHEPGASHLALLEGVAGPDIVRSSYEEALANGYLWHEFGDSHLVLP